MALALCCLLLGFAVSLGSGAVGIGGGILLAPALLWIPAWLGAGTLDAHAVSGLTTVQALAACLAGAAGHARTGAVDARLVRWMGGALVAATLAGAAASGFVSGDVVLWALACAASAAAALAWWPAPEAGEDRPAAPAPLTTAVPLAVAVGALGGLAGQGGSFLLVPLLLHVLHVPTRVAIGTSLALVLLASVAGFAGKAATGQVPVGPALALVLAAVPGAWLGAAWSRRARPAGLRAVLAGCLTAGALGLVADAIGR